MMIDPADNPETGAEPVPAISGEQAADFAALQAQAAAQVDPLAPEAVPEPPRPTLAQEISGMLSLVVKMVTPAFPSLEKIYSEEVIEGVGTALQPVCDKHGWLQGGIGGEYGEEMMALIVIGPLAFATYTGINGDIQARKAKAKENDKASGGMLADDRPKPGTMQQPGSDTVTFGAPIQ